MSLQKDVMHEEVYGTKIDFNKEIKEYFLNHLGYEKK